MHIYKILLPNLWNTSHKLLQCLKRIICHFVEENDDDLLMVSDEEVNVLEAETVVGRKRKADEAIDNEGIIINADSPTHKKLCVSSDS